MSEWDQIIITLSPEVSDREFTGILNHILQTTGARLTEHVDWRAPGVHIEINPVDGSRYE